MPVMNKHLSRFVTGIFVVIGFLNSAEAQITLSKKLPYPADRFYQRPTKSAIKQGVSGRVTIESGNRMPGPDMPLPEPRGIKRIVAFFPKLKVSQVQQLDEHGFYDMKQQPICWVVSNSKGYYQASLPSGDYSVVIYELKAWYANSYDGDMTVNPIKVNRHAVSPLDIRVNYMATY